MTHIVGRVLRLFRSLFARRPAGAYATVVAAVARRSLRLHWLLQFLAGTGMLLVLLLWLPPEPPLSSPPLGSTLEVLGEPLTVGRIADRFFAAHVLYRCTVRTTSLVVQLMPLPAAAPLLLLMHDDSWQISSASWSLRIAPLSLGRVRSISALIHMLLYYDEDSHHHPSTHAAATHSARVADIPQR